MVAVARTGGTDLHFAATSRATPARYLARQLHLVTMQLQVGLLAVFLLIKEGIEAGAVYELISK